MSSGKGHDMKIEEMILGSYISGAFKRSWSSILVDSDVKCSKETHEGDRLTS